MKDFPAWLPIIGAGLALLCLMAAMRAARRRRLVDNLPTSKTTGVFIGLVELKGAAEAEAPLVSYLAGCRCVHYAWNVTEQWERQVTETYTDSNGNTQTRTRMESGWLTVAEGGETIPFYLQDDCGSVLVRPEGAELEPLSVFRESCGRSDNLYYGKGPAGGVAGSTGRRCFTESALPLHTPLYVMGQARERTDVIAPEIAADKSAPLFLISARSEAQISSGFAWRFGGWLVLGAVLAAGGFFLRDAQREAAIVQDHSTYLLAVLVYGWLGGMAWVWMAYNSLVDLHNRTRQAWSQVDVLLKRRFDLIPRLTAAAAGLRDHEAGVQEHIAALRMQLAATPPGVPGPDYSACTPAVLALQEAYPALTAQPAFVTLQQELVNSEQRLALARGYFNDIATYYNSRLEQVPDRFIAALGGLKPQPLMLAGQFERAPVAVKFSA